jgi:hypothetical protein
MLGLYRTTWVQVIEEDNYVRRMYSCNLFLRAVYDSVLDSKFSSFAGQVWLHRSGYISAKNKYWSSITSYCCGVILSKLSHALQLFYDLLCISV